MRNLIVITIIAVMAICVPVFSAEIELSKTMVAGVGEYVFLPDVIISGPVDVSGPVWVKLTEGLVFDEKISSMKLLGSAAGKAAPIASYAQNGGWLYVPVLEPLKEGEELIISGVAVKILKPGKWVVILDYGKNDEPEAESLKFVGSRMAEKE